MAQLLHDLISNAAWKTPQQTALCAAHCVLDYQQLAAGVEAAAQALMSLGLARGERLAILLDKRPEAVLAMLGALAAGAVFVALDPALDAGQVGLALRDSGARMLLTTRGRHAELRQVLPHCPALRCVLETGSRSLPVPGLAVFGWDDIQELGAGLPLPRVQDSAAAVLLYGQPGQGRLRATMLTHRRLRDNASAIGARLGRRAQLRSLVLLPYSERCGLGLLASSFAAAAAVLLVRQVLARDVPALVDREAASLLAAPAWLWMQSAGLDWPAGHALRAAISAGGTLPRPTLATLRRRLPLAQLFLMPERLADDGALAVVDHPGVEFGLLMSG